MKFLRSRTGEARQAEPQDAQDQLLVRAALASPAAFESVVNRYYYMVFAVANAYVRDAETAEELAQEVFLRAYLHLDSLREPRALPAWLNRITRHVALRWEERRQTRSRLLPMVPLDNLPPEQPDPRSPSPREQAEARTEAARLREAVAALPPEQRELVLQHFMEDISKSELARRMGLHPSSVGRQLDRALAALRDQLTTLPLPGRRPSELAPQRGARGATAVIAAAALLSPAAKSALAAAAGDTASLGLLASATAGTSHSTSFGSLLLGKGKAAALSLVAAAGIGWTSWAVLQQTPTEMITAREARQETQASRVARSSPARPPAGREERNLSLQRTAATEQAATTLSLAQALPVTSGQLSTAEQPKKVSFLEGRVINEEGEPIDGALVDGRSWFTGSEAFTDRQGKFRLEKFYSTDDLRITKEGYTPLYLFRQPGGTLTAPFVLGRGTVLTGTVYGPDGAPAPRALLRADLGRQDNGTGYIVSHVFFESYSDQDGRYRVDLRPAKYDLLVKQGNGTARLTGVDVLALQETRLDIHLKEGIAFRAKVIDSLTSAPVAGVRVSNWQQPGFEGISDEQGNLVVEGMAPGKFEFQVEKEGYRRWWSAEAVYPHQRFQIDNPKLKWQRNFDDLEFEMTAGMKPVTIVLERGVTIRGMVLDPEEKPVKGATVAPALTGSGNSLTGDTRFSVKTDESGAFEMLLPASHEARYNLVAHDGAYGEWRSWANGVLPPIQTRPGEELNDVVLRLTRPATVKGQVLGVDGQPRPQTRVRAQAADRLENRYYDPETKTDEQGNFELKGIRAGGQYVQCEPYWMDPKDARGSSSVLLNLAEGETTSGLVLQIDPEMASRLK